MTAQDWAEQAKKTYGFTPDVNCGVCRGDGHLGFEPPEPCHFCLSAAIVRGELDGVVDGVRYCKGIEIDLLGVEWGEDFGVVDLKTGRVLMYAYYKRPSINWRIPLLTLSDEDFSILVPEGKLPPLTAETQNERDAAIGDYANWDEVVKLLLHPNFNMREWLVPAPQESEDVVD